MKSSIKRSLKSRQIGLVQTYHLISGTAATPADSGLDKAFISSITDLAPGSYKINILEPSRLNMVVAGLVPITPGAVLSVAAVDKSSVTISAISDSGVKGSKVLQDITYTARVSGSAGNAITVAYTAGGTAGAEVVTVTGNAISVQIETAVSTATQVLAAINASAAAMLLVSAAISGTAGTAQVTAAAVPLLLGANSDADFYITLIHSTLLDAVF